MDNLKPWPEGKYRRRITNFECATTLPEGKRIIAMQEFKGEVYVALEDCMCKLVWNTDLQRQELQPIHFVLEGS